MTAISSRPRRLMRRGDRAGALRVHERLPHGGTGSVHLGWLAAARRLVAVKRIHPLHGATDGGLARVRAEERVARSVVHPSVVATLAVVRRPGELLAAMEYVAGASLAEVNEAAREGLAPDIASAIAAAALRGLHAAHVVRAAAGGSCIPRRISSARVLVGEDGHARILDFDVRGPAVLRATDVVDELPYAAPEQLLRRGVDVRRDVYAASVVLWETLTGRALFQAATVEEMLGKILEGPLPPPSRFAAGVGGELDAIVLRGLARDPAARFASACAMACALEATSCAPPDGIARALAGMDLPCIRERRALADAVRIREVHQDKSLHTECNEGVAPPDMVVTTSTE